MKSRFYYPILWITALLLVRFEATAQLKSTYGNEWINYSQQYFKLQVTQKGIYRLSFDELKNAGFPTSIDPTTIQLFRRGREVALYVQGEADKKLDATDFVEFYGEESNGEADSSIYRPTKAQPNKYVNVYTDSAAYFLTYRIDGKAGKRMSSYQVENTSQQSAEPYHLAELLTAYVAGYGHGNIYPLGVNIGPIYSYYDFGEGWCEGIYSKTKPIEYKLQLNNLYREANAPMLEWQLNGLNIVPHRVEILAGKASTSNRKITTATFDFKSTFTVNEQLTWDDIATDGQLWLQASVQNSPFDEEISQRYIKLTYPQKWVYDQPFKFFKTLPKANGTSYIEIKGVGTDATMYELNNIYEPVRVGFTLKGDIAQAIIQNTQASKVLLLDRTPKRVPVIRKVSFRNISPSSHNFAVISHPKLMQSSRGIANVVQAYSAYRATVAGGKYDTLTVSILDLYNQFSFGDKSTLAIRRFADFLMQDPREKYLFLIGEPADPPQSRIFPNVFARDVIPTGGYPASDWVMVMGINNLPENVPGIAVGRLRAQNPDHVLDYLNKVKEHEATPNALWRKNFLHLGGGKTPGELNAFKSYLNDFKNIADKGYAGGKFTTISKKTDEPVEYINVTEPVNQGIGVMTFFGHSSFGVSDIDIGYVSDTRLGYNNAGKYPIMFVNGCDAGNIYSGARTFGTDWLLTPNKGAVLFLAHSYSGYPLPLKRYTDILYKYAFNDTTMTGKSVGSILVKTIKEFMNGSTDVYEITHAQQITLQGDPAIAVFPATKPDYQIDKSSLFLATLDNSPLVAATDSFRIGIIVSNLGRKNSQSFSINLKRTLNDGTVITFPKITKSAVAYQDTIYISIKNTGLNVAGNNRFDVVVDEENVVAEVSETNNQTTLDYLIPGYIASPLFPAEYAVVNTLENNLPTVRLQAQAVSLVAGEKKNYLIEIDSTATFSSTFKRSQTVASTFLPTWKVSLLSADSTVYYWRIRDADRPVSNENQWATSSFRYIKAMPEGWSQSQFSQFSKANIDRLNYQKGKWEFLEQKATISLSAAGPFVKFDSYKDNSLSINNLLMVTNGNCLNNCINAVAFNRQTLLPYSVNSSLLCGNPPFATNTLSDAGMLNDSLLAKYIDKIPVGDYVLLFTSGAISWNKWTPAMIQKLLDIGASPTVVKGLQSEFPLPYIILGQKGANKAITEVVAAEYGYSRTIVLDKFDLVDRLPDGSVVSTLVGPAREWQQANWKILKDNPKTQADSLDVWGVTLQGTETLLFSSVATPKLDLSKVNAKQYPYLRLRWRAANKTESKAAQLSQWVVSFKGMPEGLVDLSDKKLTQISDKYEGEEFSLTVKFKNVSAVAYDDSITVRQTLINRDTRKQEIKNLRVKALQAGDSVSVTLPIKTLGWGGNNTLNVFFNPRLQAEQTFNNNALEINFNVVPDKANPTLEVTFDGVQIRDGDVVSANPEIIVRLKDENKFLIRKDTTGLDLYLQRPCQNCGFQRISYRNNPQLTWTSTPDNEFRATYKPQTLADGIYKFQAQGRDLAGNLAGIVPYTISFKVVNQQGLRSFVVAPNPFSFFTKFSLSITGKTPPDEFRLSIYNAIGELVQEFTQVNSPIRVGTTDLYWDGKDAAGSSLPTGMYFYRLLLKNNGEEVPDLETGTVLRSGKVLLIR